MLTSTGVGGGDLVFLRRTLVVAVSSGDEVFMSGTVDAVLIGACCALVAAVIAD